MRLSRSSLVPVFVVALLAASGAGAHDIRLPVAADDLAVLASGAGAPRFEFVLTGQQPILLNHDPREEPTAVLVYANGVNGGSTGLLDLDPSLWTATATGFAYADPTGAVGISSVVLEQGNLTVTGDTTSWPWIPTGTVTELWFHFLFEDEWFCAQADSTTATQQANEAGRVHFTDTTAPFSCPEQVCGNGIREIGELCDDGNLVEGDGCSNDCQSDSCDAPEFGSTFEGIQEIIFESGVYQCTNPLCHDSIGPEGNLDLTASGSYEQLVNIVSSGTSADGITFFDRVEPGEPAASFLYEKLAAKTLGTPTILTPMPSVFPALTPQHLEAIERWIRAGAPEDLVVEQTAGLLGTCLPPEDPLKVDPPEYPPTGEAVQLRSTAWPLASQSEDEVCFATHYDLTGTNLVPEEDQLDCPPGAGGPFNPSNKCFYWNRRVLRQDAQSHHSIIQIYLGDSTELTGDFGPFSYKPNYPAEPGAPSGACDPFEIDPSTGVNDDCSSPVVSGVTCTGFGPNDVATRSPAFAGSQEPFADNDYFEGVYGILPMAGLIIWNSHAFNLTDTDSTMAHYLDMEFGDPEDRDFPARGIFDVSKIFVQEVPPRETREYCKTFTVESDQTTLENAQVIELSSHTHRWGTQFRIWGPPQTPCNPGGVVQFTCEPNCACGPGEPEDLLYFSTSYTDPVQLEFDPPMPLGASTLERTFLYCSVYDNGSTPQSPPVKQQSTSPSSPPFKVQGLPLEIGGPCPDVETPYPAEGPIEGLFGTIPGVMCMDGQNAGVACGEELDPATFCETEVGAGNGVCDACSVLGGFTTEDEMYILIGTYFIPEPSATALAAAALATLVTLGARAKRRRSVP
jgi:cysteine-rich repeat protein